MLNYKREYAKHENQHAKASAYHYSGKKSGPDDLAVCFQQTEYFRNIFYCDPRYGQARSGRYELVPDSKIGQRIEFVESS
jgi:hypothetical protein